MNYSVSVRRGFGFANAKKNKLTRILKILRSWAVRHKTRRHLADIPDYLLKDIGLDRRQISIEIRKPFWRS